MLFCKAAQAIPPTPPAVEHHGPPDGAVPHGSPLRRCSSDPFMALPPQSLSRADRYATAPIPPFNKMSPAGLLAASMTTQDLQAHLLLDHAVTDLEERLRRAMGPWALYGLRYATVVGVALATVVKIGISITPIVTPIVPLVGVGIFLGVIVGGVLVGAVIQTIARHRFNNSGQGPKLFLAELQMYEAQLTQKPALTGMEIRTLRRLQILRADMTGGFGHSLWSILYGLTGFDPQLSAMMRQAQRTPPPWVPAKA